MKITLTLIAITLTLLAVSAQALDYQQLGAVKAFEGTDFSTVENLNSKGSLLEPYARALLAAGKKIKAIETFDQLLQLNLPAPWKDRINKELDQMAEDF